MSGFALAAGPVETSIFAVQGVDVDVTDTDATTAKNKALVDVQMKAIVLLAQRLGSPEVAAEVGKLDQKAVLPLLRSLSIEQESTAPGRYIGKFTVRFLPAKIQKLLGNYGISVNTEQAKPMLVLPVWKTATGLELWEDNVWRNTWISQHLEQSLVPIIIPLGDAEDTAGLNADDVLKLDPIKLEALRRRYDVKTVLIATAEAAEGDGIHAVMTGSSELGKINFDKVYTGSPATLESSATLAVTRIHQVMVDKYKSDKQRAIAQAEAAKAQQEGSASHSVPVTVPFSGPSEWNGLRARILATPGVIGVDVSSLAPNGAVVRLMYVGDLQTVQNSIQSTGLQMSQVGGAWVIQPL
jgi:hypothetical protein